MAAYDARSGMTITDEQRDELDAILSKAAPGDHAGDTDHHVGDLIMAAYVLGREHGWGDR